MRWPLRDKVEELQNENTKSREYRNVRWASRSSNTPGLQTNTDGSVAVYFGPKAPAGKESNWVPTDAKGPFEVLFRFYGPEKALFDKTWVLSDIEKMGKR